MNTCDTCKWWEQHCEYSVCVPDGEVEFPEGRRNITKRLNRGTCGRFSVWLSEPPLDGFMPESNPLAACQSNGLCTGPKFGCLHWSVSDAEAIARCCPNDAHEEYPANNIAGIQLYSCRKCRSYRAEGERWQHD